MDNKERKIIRYEVSWPSGPNPSYRMTFPPEQFKDRLSAGFVVDFRRTLNSMQKGGKTVTIDLDECDVYRIERTVTVTKYKVDIPNMEERFVDRDIIDNDDTLLTD